MRNFFSYKLIILLLLSWLYGKPVAAQEKPESLSFQKNAASDWLDWSDRKTKAVWLSILIPGSGQTYLGHDYKGAGLTLGFFASTLTAILAENNFSGRQDRINTLTNDYKGAGNYNLANTYWTQIQFEKGNRDNDLKRRNIFIAVTAAVYIYNVIDILYLTDDFGGVEFSMAPAYNSVELFGGETASFTGIALHLNLP